MPPRDVNGVNVSVGSISPESIPSYINRYSDWQWMAIIHG